MELAKYLKITSTSDEAFAKKVGRDRSTVTRWRLGSSRPDWTLLEKIEEVTDGAVTANDFAKRRPVEAAE